MQQRIGRYQIIEEIASGGQATVYRARDVTLQRDVALKVLHPHMARDAAYLERFQREARMAASLNHPNVIVIHEIGSEGDQHFIAMEHLPQSAHGLMEAQGQLFIDRAVDICRQSALALQVAHQRGIIHRDIKPQNILLTADGTARVSDFGIARATDMSTMTRTGMVMGTPHYMSPEQARGDQADIRSDIYSLGIVLYEMLTGALPFDADTPWEVIRQHIEARPTPVNQLRSDIPSSLGRIVSRCLEKDPFRRYQTPQQLAQALQQVTNEGRGAPGVVAGQVSRSGMRGFWYAASGVAIVAVVITAAVGGFLMASEGIFGGASTPPASPPSTPAPAASSASLPPAPTNASVLPTPNPASLPPNTGDNRAIPVSQSANAISINLEDPGESGAYVFDPMELTFQVGETVNLSLRAETEFHTFTVDDLGIDVSVDAGTAETLTFTFDQPGTFKLICIPHEALGMVGTIAVQGAPVAFAPSPTNTAVPAPIPAPAFPRPTATPVISGVQPLQTGGTLTIAVSDTDEPNGLPRFCTAGCSETIYLSGQTETLFNARANRDGTVGFEPMLATDFSLDPGLEFAAFSLRPDVQFHNGWGVMTAEDVAFSFNDANAYTNPESIHGQAHDFFGPTIASMEAVDEFTVRLNYRNYDSRGILLLFSNFWQSAGIVSKAVFDAKGDQMQNDFTGVGPFVVDEWTDDKGIFLHAFEDYYARGEGNIGPFVEDVRWLQIPEPASRRAMLETREAQIIESDLKDLDGLINKGFKENRDSLNNTTWSVGFAGNYWERFDARTGAEMERERDITKPWVGDPFENSANYDENTPSMQRAMKVRNAFAHSIDRQSMVDNLISGLGTVNHQPYLSVNHPNYRPEWGWQYDPDFARQLMTEAGYNNGFEMDMWVNLPNRLSSELGEALSMGWQQSLGVKVNLINTAYSTFRPGLVARTATTPFIRCGDEIHTNFPYDWPRGFAMSSTSSGGYGVGVEVPFATEAYLQMATEPDKTKRWAWSARFFEEQRKWALCVGILETPSWSMYDPDEVAEWDQRPNVNWNLGGINNVRSIKLK